MRPSSPSSAMPTSIFGRTVGPRSSHAAPHRQSGLDIRSTHGSAVSSSGSRVTNRFFTGGWGVARGPVSSSAGRVGRQPQSTHPERAGRFSLTAGPAGGLVRCVEAVRVRVVSFAGSWRSHAFLTPVTPWSCETMTHVAHFLADRRWRSTLRPWLGRDDHFHSR